MAADQETNMADDKKPVKQGVTDTMTLANELAKGGLTENDWDYIKKANTDIDKNAPLGHNKSIVGLGMSDFGGGDTPADYQEYIQNTMGSRGEDGTMSSAVWGLKDDKNRIEDPKTLDLTGRLLAAEAGTTAALEHMQSSDAWKKSEREQNWGTTILGIGAAVGIPALGLLGILLGGKGKRAQNQMMSSLLEGRAKVLEDNKPTASEALSRQKDIENSMQTVQNAVQYGGDVDAAIIAETARLKASYPDISDDVLRTSFASARIEQGTAEDEVTKKGSKSVLEDARVNVVNQIDVFRKGGAPSEAVDEAYKGNFDSAANKLYGGLEGTSASGYDAKKTFDETFALEKPGDLTKIADITDERTKHLNRSAPVDDIIMTGTGKTTVDAEDAKRIGYISAADMEQEPALKYITSEAPIVVQASEFFWWMYNNKRWEKVEGGYKAMGPTSIKTVTTGGGATAGGITARGEKRINYIPLSDRVYKHIDEIGLMADMDMNGLPTETKERLREAAELFRR